MRLNTNMAEVFDSPAKIAVAKYVIKPGFMMTGRELAKLCGVSHSWVIEILKEFEEINFVSSRRAGNSVVWSPKIDSYAYLTAKKLFGGEKMFLPVEHLKNLIKKALKRKFVKKAVIFGSVARKDEKSSSDIDLFVLVNKAKEKKKMEKVLEDLSMKCVQLYGNTLGFYLLTENELKKRKNLAVIKNIEKGIKLI